MKITQNHWMWGVVLGGVVCFLAAGVHAAEFGVTRQPGDQRQDADSAKASMLTVDPSATTTSSQKADDPAQAVAYRIKPIFFVGPTRGTEPVNEGMANSAGWNAFGPVPWILDSDPSDPSGVEPWRTATDVRRRYTLNTGLAYEPVAGTQIGLIFRSSLLDGPDSRPADAASQITLFKPGSSAISTHAESDRHDAVSLRAYHQINVKWALLADVTYGKQLPSEKALAIQLGGEAQDGKLSVGGDDTWRYGLGMIFVPVDQWTIQAGLAFDQTLQAESAGRAADQNRIWAAAGLGYHSSDMMALNVEYLRSLGIDAAFDNAADGAKPPVFGLLSDGENSVDMISIQLNIHF